MSGYIMHWIIGVSFAYFLVLLDWFLEWNFISHDPMFLIAIGMIALFFAVLPDIDTPASVVRMFSFVSLFIIIIVLVYFGYTFPWVIILSVSAICIMFLKHRGITHSILLAFIAPIALIYFSGWILYTIGVVAYLSHLLVDRLT